SETWGSGIGRFANPPYDLGAWGEFRTRVDAASAKADALCSCDADSCRKSRQAISDLRTLVSDLDTSIRHGSPPPGDIVPRQAQSSPIADGLNAAQKYVATHRPESLEWGPFEGLGPDIVEDVRRIKSQDGPDLILWGSSTLTSTLLEHGLADEVLLAVYPVLLG